MSDSTVTPAPAAPDQQATADDDTMTLAEARAVQAVLWKAYTAATAALASPWLEAKQRADRIEAREAEKAQGGAPAVAPPIQMAQRRDERAGRVGPVA